VTPRPAGSVNSAIRSSRPASSATHRRSRSAAAAGLRKLLAAAERTDEEIAAEADRRDLGSGTSDRGTTAVQSPRLEPPGAISVRTVQVWPIMKE